MEFSEVIEVLDRGSSIDVQSNCTFDSLMIGRATLERLAANQFNKPSPVQAKAIPVGLLGRDMLVQAKSGTGKTLVFSVLAVENLDVTASYIQKVIVAPTREIAVQIRETVRKIAPTGSRTSVFVGGHPHKQNVIELQTKHPQIVIGTTGRLCQLMKLGAVDISRVDLFVLDEADKLMDDVFKDDVNYLINSLPPVRQVAVFSATYPRNLDILLSTFLRDAALVRFNADDVQLVGIKQYVISKCSPIPEKLTQVLKSVRYVQALVFCDQVTKCEPIANYLKAEGLDVTFVSSAMSQKERQTAVDRLRAKRVKILVSSDLTARGIDADHVNLVVNIDAAANEETYFHRIGRAARFGAHGAAITLLEDDKAMKCFTALAYRGHVNVKRAKLDELPDDLPKNTAYWEGLPFFIDFDQKKKKARNNDLENVPDRQAAIDALSSERSASETGLPLKYDRTSMISLRGAVPASSNDSGVETGVRSETSPSGSGDEKENEKKEENKKEESTEAEEKAVPVQKTFKERLAELKAQVAAKKKDNAAVEKKVEVQEEKKPKFKFVPTREKAKKKYYMRGELQHIREAFTSEQWRAYAETKFDFNQEPFISASPKVIEAPNASEESVTTTVAREPSPEATEASQSSKTQKKKKNNSGKPRTIKYSRYRMIQIQMQVPKEDWLPYVTSKWDTSEEPWELNPSERCSQAEKFRRQRWKEKEERKKVMEERKKKREEERTELVASGRTTQLIEVKEGSWEDFQEDVRRDFEEKLALRKEREEMEKAGKSVDKKRIGPVVPARDPPLIHKYRVDLYKRRLDEQDAFLAQETRLETKAIVEVETQTDEEKKKVLLDGESQTEVTEKEEEYEDYEDEEYWDEGEEWYDEEEADTSQVPQAAEDPTRHFRGTLGASYARNINFQAATQSYMDLMNAAFFRRPQ